jgi:mono/diheme cytochrome c family protein
MDRPSLIGALLTGASLLGAMSLGALAARDAASGPPDPAPARGRQLFVQSCAHCHGDDARGRGEDGDGPDLYRLAIGNARISAVIRTGIPEEMPSFAKKLGPAEVEALTAYLRSLR